MNEIEVNDETTNARNNFLTPTLLSSITDFVTIVKRLCQIPTLENIIKYDNKEEKENNKNFYPTETNNISINIEKLSNQIQKLPSELIAYIASYTYIPQNQDLLHDIRNFGLTSNFLLHKVCHGDKSLMTEKIISEYNDFYLYKNINEHVERKIKKWINKNKHIEYIEDFILITYPDEFVLFEGETKWIFLWGVLKPQYRNIYSNRLYSSMNTDI